MVILRNWEASFSSRLEKKFKILSPIKENDRKLEGKPTLLVRRTFKKCNSAAWMMGVIWELISCLQKKGDKRKTPIADRNRPLRSRHKSFPFWMGAFSTFPGCYMSANASQDVLRRVVVHPPKVSTHGAERAREWELFRSRPTRRGFSEHVPVGKTKTNQ